MFRFFENLIDPFDDAPMPDNPPQTLWAFLWDYCRPFKNVFAATAIFAIIAAIGEVFLIYALGWLTDTMVAKSPETVLAQDFPKLIALGIFVIFFRPLLNIADVGLLNNSLMPNVATAFRWRAHKHVLRQSIGWFENDFAGRVANRVMQTPGAAGAVVHTVLDALAYALAYVIGATVLIQDAHPLLLIPIGIWFVGYIILVRWTLRHVEPASKAASDARSELNGRVVDSYTNIHSVKMFAKQSSELQYARDAIANTRSTVIQEMRIFSKMDIGLVVVNGVLLVGLVGWSIYLWLTGTVSAGVVIAATALALRLDAMAHWIMWSITGLFRELGVIREGMQTLAHPIMLQDAPDARALSITKAGIEFRDLSHHYGRDTGGLDGLNLVIQPGEKVGLVGRSGAGKSTLLKLLLRFYDPESGQIIIDGQNITTLTQDSLRSQIGMVQQESSLMHRSIRDNIAYGKHDATEQDITQAAQRAYAMEFIETLVDNEGNQGLDAKVGERGVKLSGGQRQRIALARVILKDAPILLLDEATSALDSEVETAILDSLYQMMQGKTVVAIAHRLSTIAQMDRIVVMDNGRIIEDGTHQELLSQGGLYADLWARQSGGFINMKAD